MIPDVIRSAKELKSRFGIGSRHALPGNSGNDSMGRVLAAGDMAANLSGEKFNLAGLKTGHYMGSLNP